MSQSTSHAAVSMLQALHRGGRAPRPGLVPVPGPYLGRTERGSHRISFRVDAGRATDLRVGERLLATEAPIVDGLLRVSRGGTELAACWVDDRHIEGELRRSGRFGRIETTHFVAKR